jgi:hypothetical protein
VWLINLLNIGGFSFRILMKQFIAVSRSSETNSYSIFAKSFSFLHPFRETFCKTFQETLRETAKYVKFHKVAA